MGVGSGFGVFSAFCEIAGLTSSRFISLFTLDEFEQPADISSRKIKYVQIFFIGMPPKKYSDYIIAYKLLLYKEKFK